MHKNNIEQLKKSNRTQSTSAYTTQALEKYKKQASKMPSCLLGNNSKEPIRAFWQLMSNIAPTYFLLGHGNPVEKVPAHRRPC